MTDKEKIQSWFNKLQEVESGITDGERKFLDSIYKCFQRDGTITGKQLAIIVRIFARRV